MNKPNPNKDPFRILELRQVVSELDSLNTSAPHAFELMFDSQVMTHVLDELQGMIDLARDEGNANGELHS